MNKTDMVKKFRNKYGVTNDLAKEYVEGMFDIFTEGLKTDGRVAYTGFGALTTKNVPERKQVSPQGTGEMLTIPEHNRIAFRPFPELKDAVNE